MRFGRRLEGLDNPERKITNIEKNINNSQSNTQYQQPKVNQQKWQYHNLPGDLEDKKNNLLKEIKELGEKFGELEKKKANPWDRSTDEAKKISNKILEKENELISLIADFNNNRNKYTSESSVLVSAKNNPIILNEGLFSQYKEKPFVGKYNNTKLIIYKGVNNIDIDKAVDYIERNIFPVLDRVIPSIAEYTMTVGQMQNQNKKDKIIEDRYKHLYIDITSTKSMIGGHNYEGKKYGDPYVLTAYTGNVSIVFTGTIDDNGNMNFTYRKAVITTYQ